MLTRQLVIFARAPRLGAVKRRLARDVGALAACRFHRNTIADLTRRLSRDPRWSTWLAITPDRGLVAWRKLWRGDYGLLAQGAGDLGARMGRVIGQRPPGPVVIVGSDIPGIRRAHIAEAFRLLGRHDWVLGPADDGGYWLIGARRRPRLALPFEGVAWGGPEALSQTVANLGGQRVAYLETLIDVDRGEDLARLRNR